jgi:hypothetical protein
MNIERGNRQSWRTTATIWPLKVSVFGIISQWFWLQALIGVSLYVLFITTTLDM